MMPRGSHYEETGWLFEDRGELSFSSDAGGSRLLDAPPYAILFSGRRVRVIGTLSAGDMLDVSEIHAL